MQINSGGCRCGCEHLRLSSLAFFFVPFLVAVPKFPTFFVLERIRISYLNLFCGTLAAVSDAVATVRMLPTLLVQNSPLPRTALSGRITSAAAAICVLGIFQRSVRRCCVCCASPWRASYSDKTLANAVSVLRTNFRCRNRRAERTEGQQILEMLDDDGEVKVRRSFPEEKRLLWHRHTFNCDFEVEVSHLRSRTFF